tara:strand:- start:496 stop:687 length:192 start_codon:yes stop_codon:yes gene_type:complete
MNKEEIINKIMSLVNEKSSLSIDKLEVFRDVLSSLKEKELNQLVAGIMFVETPFKSKKVWRIE